MHKYDTRDAEEHAAVRTILDALPEGHPARAAYRDGACTIALTYVVGDRALSEQLAGAYLAGLGRIMDRTRHFRP